MEENSETEVATAGERLRAAREQKGLGLEDIAAQTRIPLRHLESIERGEWDKLPAPTYSIGFARSYASCVDLDRTEIADQLRGEMGGQRPTSSTAEVFEPADPARTMPKWLVFGAIAAVLLLVLVMTWLSRRSLEDSAAPTNEAASAASAPATTAAPAPEPATGPVVLTANEEVWISVKDGPVVLKQGTLAAGQRYDVPVTAKAPTLTTGKPEALRISVGTADAPAVGPPATTVSNVSLLGPDLMRPRQQAAPGTASAPAG